MNAYRSIRKRSRRGFAVVLAVLVLSLFACLGVAYACLTNDNLLRSQNHAESEAARMQAESGLAFLGYLMALPSLPPGEGQPVLDGLATYLSTELNGTATLQGGTVQYDGVTIRVPAVRFGQSGRTFSAEITMPEPDRMRLRTFGRAEDARRSVGMDYDVEPEMHWIFGFGLAAKGPVWMENTAKLTGVIQPTDGKLLSTASGVALTLRNAGTIGGDVFATNPAALVSLTGSGSIGGVSVSNPAVMNHVHIGVGQSDFPVMDTSVFEPFATNIVDSSTVTSGFLTFTNIRIKANTNPTFSNGVRINGVIFVETPNVVAFRNTVAVTGVIVTEQASPPGPANQLEFENTVQLNGVEQLPDTPPFADLRELTGTTILAPGFRVKFRNASGVIGGVMAADKFLFENSFNTVLYGGIISYGTEMLKIENSASILINSSKLTQPPAGFLVPNKLVANPGTYVEY